MFDLQGLVEGLVEPIQSIGGFREDLIGLYCSTVDIVYYLLVNFQLNLYFPVDTFYILSDFLGG